MCIVAIVVIFVCSLSLFGISNASCVSLSFHLVMIPRIGVGVHVSLAQLGVADFFEGVCAGLFLLGSELGAELACRRGCLFGAELGGGLVNVGREGDGGLLGFTSAASAAFLLASSAAEDEPPPLVLPSVRGGPPAFCGGLDALAGTDAVLGAAGAESSRRPGEEKWSDSFPQRLPMMKGGWVGGKGCDGGWLSRGGLVALGGSE